MSQPPEPPNSGPFPPAGPPQGGGFSPQPGHYPPNPGPPPGQNFGPNYGPNPQGGYFPGGPGQPPKKSKTGLIIALAVVVVLLLGGGVVALVLNSKGDNPPAAGGSTGAPSASSSAPLAPPGTSAPQAPGQSSGNLPDNSAVPEPILKLANELQSTLNFKNLDSLLTTVCDPANNATEARADVLKSLPALEATDPNHGKPWNFDLGKVSGPNDAKQYGINLHGVFRDDSQKFDVTFTSYIEDGKGFWCGFQLNQ